MIREYRICWEMKGGRSGNGEWNAYSAEHPDTPHAWIRELDQDPNTKRSWLEWQGAEPEEAEESLAQSFTGGSLSQAVHLFEGLGLLDMFYEVNPSLKPESEEELR